MRTCRSVEAQTFRDFEWLVVDGASSDGTVEFLSKLPLGVCRWTSALDDGLYDAMNIGINRAMGSYLLFLNSGDELANDDALFKVAKFIKDTGSDFVYGDSLEYGQDGFILKPARNHSFLWYGMFTHHQAMFYKKCNVGDLQYDTNLRIGADYGFTVAFLGKCTQPGRLLMPVCLFEPNGLSSKNFEQGLLDQYNIRRNILRYHPLVCWAILLLHKAVYSIKINAPSLYEKLRYIKR